MLEKEFQAKASQIFTNHAFDREKSSIRGELILEMKKMVYGSGKGSAILAVFTWGGGKQEKSVRVEDGFDSILLTSYSYGNWGTTYFRVGELEKKVNPVIQFRI